MVDTIIVFAHGFLRRRWKFVQLLRVDMIAYRLFGDLFESEHILVFD